MRSAALLTVLVLASCTAAVPDDPVAACSWSWTDLPLPPDRDPERVVVQVSDGRGTYAGSAFPPDDGPQEAVLWQDGRATLLDRAFERATEVRAVNSAGVVVAQAGAAAVRFRDGHWERLAAPDRAYVEATRVDGGGNAIGWISEVPQVDDAGNAVGETRGQYWVRWPSDRPDVYEEIEFSSPNGWVTGLADDGTLLALGRGEDPGEPVHGYLGRPDGTWTKLDDPDEGGDVKPVAVGGGVVVGTFQSWGNRKTLMEWDLDGRVIRTHPDAEAIDVNSSGQVLGMTYPERRTMVWKGGASQGRFLAPGDGGVVAVAIDDDGAVVGSTGAGPSRSVVSRCS